MIPATVIGTENTPQQPHQRWEGKRGTLANPGPPGYTNTITRAELVAVLAYLPWAEDKGMTAGLATDSYAAMMLIAMMVRAPHKLLLHPHRWLLWDIAKAIDRRTEPLHIYKIKSHTGVQGNDQAHPSTKLPARPASHATPVHQV